MSNDCDRRGGYRIAEDDPAVLSSLTGSSRRRDDVGMKVARYRQDSADRLVTTRITYINFGSLWLPVVKSMLLLS